METEALIVDFLRWAKNDGKFMDKPFQQLAADYIKSKQPTLGMMLIEAPVGSIVIPPKMLMEKPWDTIDSVIKNVLAEHINSGIQNCSAELLKELKKYLLPTI